MAHQIPYGRTEPLVLEFGDELQVIDGAVPRGNPIADVEQAVRAALQSPLDFPPLAESVVPGDRVVIPVSDGIPQVAWILSGLINTLIENGTAPHSITILKAVKPKNSKEPDLATAANGLLCHLPDAWRNQIELVWHDPDDPNATAYLAASKGGDPLYVHRLLSDADIVIPVGVLRVGARKGPRSNFDDLFPAFSNRETQQRYRAHDEKDWKTQAKLRRDDANEVGWWLGVQFTLQVIPGADDFILQVLAGHCDAVFSQGRELTRAAWRVELTELAPMVVASIAGGPEQQTWECFSRALNAASKLVEDHGVIVLCTNLRGKLGPNLRKLADWSVGDPLPSSLRRDRNPDALAALALADARQHARVYLFSGLDSDTVEDLGIGFVSQANEIERLAKKQGACLLLANAQYVEAVIGGE